MTSWQVVGLVGALLLIDLAIIGAVIAAVGRPLRELAAKYPPREPAGDAVFKEFQSARIGMRAWTRSTCTCARHGWRGASA
jgi:hypothetical protein